MDRGESFPFILALLSAPLSLWNLYKIRSSEREASDEWENEQTSTQLIWNSLFPIDLLGFRYIISYKGFALLSSIQVF